MIQTGDNGYILINMERQFKIGPSKKREKFNLANKWPKEPALVLSYFQI